MFLKYKPVHSERLLVKGLPAPTILYGAVVLVLVLVERLELGWGEKRKGRKGRYSDNVVCEIQREMTVVVLRREKETM